MGVKEDHFNQTDEKSFLSAYNIQAFDRPSVATDVVVLSMFEEEAENHRKDSKPQLHVLLIKRGEHPYMNCWALPGGFLRSEETIEQCASREIKEETNLSLSSLMPIGVFSEPDRDPRGRILSVAYASIVKEKAAVMGGTDAINADWFALEYEYEDDVLGLNLKNAEANLSARLKSKKAAFKDVEFDEVSNEGLAFDHAKIIATALLTLRKRMDEGEVAFAFLPETFTLSSLQRVYEIIGGASLLTANFRRKTAHLVRETENFTEGAGHRPARLFRKEKQR